jgi:gliding motility associated protien GldN
MAMKKVFSSKTLWLLAISALVAGGATAQNVTNPATGNAVTPPPPPPQETYQGQVTPQGVSGVSLRPDNVFGVDSTKPSLRNDWAVDRDTSSTVPLTYQYIRPDDAIWGKRVWVEIDTHQKMNLPFRYPGYDERGNSLTLINILLNAVTQDSIQAFNPIDDRFTTPMSPAEVAQEVHGQAQNIRVTNPITGQETDTTIYNDFDPNSVSRYRLKEDWVFDKGTSTLYCRIIGIAPERTVLNDDGSIRAYAPMFWIYYPDIRPVLAKYDVFNPNNYYQRLSWEDLFELKFFASYVIKEDNPFDRSIRDYIPGESQEAGVKRLLEGKKIKDEIFNYEQDLWAY